MIPPGLTEALAWLGLLITGVWTAYRTHRQEIDLSKVKKASQKAASELTPNHGSSVKDALARIEETLREQKIEQAHQSQQLKHQSEMTKGLAHQLGEHIRIANTQLTSQDASINELRSRVGRIEDD